MKLIIIGTGWYGLHIYSYIKKYHKEFDILLIEKCSEILNNSSFYNQNRLHIGYHYPRSHKTRELCKSNYNRFIKEYIKTIDEINNNYYCISKDSILDYNTYIKIFSNDDVYNHTIDKNDFLKNIDGDFINTNEKIINSHKVKKYFESLISESEIKFNYTVNDIKKENKKIKINNDLDCDILLDCSFNSLGIDKDCIYELTISLVYSRINKERDYGAITVMDGDFFSIFPRDDNLYTLTHVKYTPLIKSENVNEIINYKVSEEKVEEIKKLMENDVDKYYKDFLKDFKYEDFFVSYKCKKKTSCDLRDCNIIEKDNIISVHCGKITGIFEFEDYIKKYLDSYKQL